MLTGEGRSDRQTLQGKVPLGVLQRAQAWLSATTTASALSGAAATATAATATAIAASSATATSGAVDVASSRGVPVVLLSGRIDDAPALHSAGFARLIEVSPRDLPLSRALDPAVARQNLRTAVRKLRP